MNRSLKSILTLCSVMAVSACTTGQHKQSDPLLSAGSQAAIADSSLLQAVASAEIGVPGQYVDVKSGRTMQLIVESEYFSANGRICRRFVKQDLSLIHI